MKRYLFLYAAMNKLSQKNSRVVFVPELRKVRATVLAQRDFFAQAFLQIFLGSARPADGRAYHISLRVCLRTIRQKASPWLRCSETLKKPTATSDSTIHPTSVLFHISCATPVEPDCTVSYQEVLAVYACSKLSNINPYS